jgi:ADP-ribose pyrophosphatase
MAEGGGPADRRPGAPPVPAPAADPSGWQAAPALCLESRVVFAGRRIQLRQERVLLPNQRQTELELIRHPGAAAILPLLESGEVILVRQYRYATGGWLLEVPAGTLEPGEDPAACAARELVEETGYQAATLQPLGWIWTTPGFTDERIWLYLATGISAGRQALEDDELLTLVRLPLAQAVAMAESGEIVDGKSVATLGRAAAHLRAR